MNRSRALAFLIAAFAGAAIWALSPWLTGHAEPWDAGGVYYTAALIGTGLLTGLIVPKPLWALYTGGVFGQFMYLLLLPSGPLIAVGLVFLLLWSLLFPGGAYLGARVRSSRRPDVG
ncbi:hypothetical protein [Pseudomonas sp. Q2-TVG4-2]|uniref:hypothetical protein n=1 Tax=Pseudomonas sp. Q2-TVG4-2 TaxID=1685699 RepID=UPI0015E6C6F4|nr:hypothetical protein [Pseudomonas sp. Q2-TVG4-2]